ncbi:hypothetical protein HPB50_003383 [Hyalomma asiaticum]|uniref:Uncharacterized protein n=1 Tax=Hyalomma asiaticum TaxID=266040 RepID=A0ACB7TI33_HYAAI|nr:hypothetical protein HPB50_003383 [Hyalomma asiaticum]
MREYLAAERNEEQSYKVTKKADIRFNAVTFRYKERIELEVPTGQPMPQANQVQAQLEDGGEPSWLSWLRSPTQVLPFLVSGLLRFAMGLIVPRMFLASNSNDGMCPPLLLCSSTNTASTDGQLTVTRL